MVQAINRKDLDTRIDSNEAIVIGQGTRAGLYQSASMLKPANVAYVYPLSGGPRKELEVPEYLEKDMGLIIFNVEANNADDLMSSSD